jgi:drug/metabolite transporter (DMT)-like permease
MKQKNGWHYLATVGAMLIWSSSFIATKVAYRTFAPITLAAARFLVALVMLGIARLAMRSASSDEKGACTHRVQRADGHHAVFPAGERGP